MLELALAVLGGVLIGLSLGALGGGGSILAVPVLVHVLGQSPAQATTGSLVVVGVTALLGAITAHQAGNVLPRHGAMFALMAIGGAVAGAKASALVSESTLLACFSLLMLLVGVMMAVRQVRPRRAARQQATPDAVDPGPGWPRTLKLLGTATLVGLLTGFLGVGGGFLIVPALLLVLALPMEMAVGTSLVVITVTSAVAFGVRTDVGPAPDWGLVLVLTVVSALAAVLGARLATRVDRDRLSAAFTVLVMGVAAYTAFQAVPAVL